jgi:hypothetical protein
MKGQAFGGGVGMWRYIPALSHTILRESSALLLSVLCYGTDQIDAGSRNFQ